MTTGEQHQEPGPAIDDEETGAGPPVRAGLHDRLRAKALATVGELRFVSQRPPALLEHIAYARAGEWTEEIDGYRRHLAVIYAWVVAIPVSTLAYLTVWAAARPGRCAAMVVITALVNTALNEIPVVEWLVPDWATIPYWPPFSWIF